MTSRSAEGAESADIDLTSIATPERSTLLLHQIMEESATRFAGNVAIEIPPGRDRPARQRLTYAELDQAANRLAARLAPYVQTECVVVILLPRVTPLLFVAQLGLLKAGAAYTCIDPNTPLAQIQYLVEDTECSCVVTTSALQSLVSDVSLLPATVLIDEDDPDDHAALSIPIPPPAWLAPSSLAYVIYTSGSTGRPKGVLIEHASIVNLVESDRRYFGLVPSDRVAQGSSPAYDSSIEETWLALAVGATVVVVDDETLRDGPDLVPWLRHERITVLCPPPTLLASTGCDDPAAALPDLRLLYVGGEALPAELADRWSRGRWMENGYGPTECTVTVVRGLVEPGESVIIGRPVDGNHAFVLDAFEYEVAPGEPGELFIGGVSVARGYLNRPQLTEERFRHHPKLGRLYRTGDRVRRNRDGELVYLGRVDSQVKIRGHRIELGGVEAELLASPGVRGAACALQGNSEPRLVACLVATNREAPPSFASLRRDLRDRVAEIMVPSRFLWVDELPTTTGGKLNRAALPTVPPEETSPLDPRQTPDGPIEFAITDAFEQHLNQRPAVDADFFELGGDSLRAALVISSLRRSPLTRDLTVRDLYEARSVRALALRVVPVVQAEVDRPERGRATAHPIAATSVQLAVLLVGVMIGANVARVVAIDLLPGCIETVGVVGTLIAIPLLSMALVAIYAPMSVGVAVLTKKALIGRYRAGRTPVWSSLYVRHWIVQLAASFIPWRLFRGTELQCVVLRALGARIGARVDIHHGVDLRGGGWDLLTIGDDASIGADAALRLTELSGGDLVIGSVTLGARSTVAVRAGVSGGAKLSDGAFLGPLSMLPAGETIPPGERWSGLPATLDGPSPDAGRVDRPPTPPFRFTLLMIVARWGVATAVGLPALHLAAALYYVADVDAEGVVDWLRSGFLDPTATLLLAGWVALSGLGALGMQAIVSRGLGEVRRGTVGRFSLAYVRISLKQDLLQSASQVLSGTLFWPRWLRAAGSRVGVDCEVSTIVDVIPELLTIGDHSFLADGVYLGGPSHHRGAVYADQTSLGRNTFLGNHAVVEPGNKLPDDILVGISTVADVDQIERGTSWFGIPPFQLPRREVVQLDPRLTHHPTRVAYVRRLAWESLRLLLPIGPMIAFLAWYQLLSQLPPPSPLGSFVATTASSLLVAAGMAAVVVTLKWILLGRVRPGQHGLWSGWCCRWDFLYVAWGAWATPFLAPLSGTLLLALWLRAMGCQVGQRVILGGGFAQVVDPDMLRFEDDATVASLFQAHSFEDRVLKTDYVAIGKRATAGADAILLYGASLGSDTEVAPQSVVMKHETLLAGSRYLGSPTRPVLPLNVPT